jgi:DNA-binding NtrC family response regulator
MTAWGSVEGAVEAMRRGARDYVQKPWDNERLLTTVRTQTELARALRRTRRLEAEGSRRREHELPELIAESVAMQSVLRVMDRVAPSEANVLVTGEHGTGKEVVARWIHARSGRAGGPFVPVNAGALAEGVFESELFGHVRGAFTDAKSDRAGCFGMADGGTLFLDEIGTMPASQQAKLLRVLQTGEFHRVGSSKLERADVRVVSATNVDVGSEVAGGRFREDLLYRLNTVEIVLPPLRDRREDVAALATSFFERNVARYGSRVGGFSAAAMQTLLEHAWPGNVRELQHVVERSVLMAHGQLIEPEDLGLRARRESQGSRVEQMTLAEAETYLIQKALSRHEGNVIEAARVLGLSRSALYRRLQQYGIKVPG